MNETTKNVIRRVIFTLDQIEVRGKENLNCLLGSIQVLEQILADSETIEEESKDG